jgi:hypothetical protein
MADLERGREGEAGLLRLVASNWDLGLGLGLGFGYGHWLLLSLRV